MKLTGSFKVNAIKKKTAAKFFKDLVVGDSFILVYNLSGRYASAPTIDIYYKGKYIHTNNALQLSENLDKFILEQI